MDEFHPVVVVNMEEEDERDENKPVDGDGSVLSQDGGDASSDESAYTENHPQPTQEDHSTEDPQPRNQDPQPHSQDPQPHSQDPQPHSQDHQPHNEDPHTPNQVHQPENQDLQTDGLPFPENRGPESGDFAAAGTRKPNKCIYECPDCGKTYGQLGYLLNHQRVHRQASKSLVLELEQLKKKSFSCETCGRSYSRASALDAHRRCHEGKLIKGKVGRARNGGRRARDAAAAAAAARTEESVGGDGVLGDAEGLLGGDASAGETFNAEGDKGAGHSGLTEGRVEDKGAGDNVLTEGHVEGKGARDRTVGAPVGDNVLPGQPVVAQSAGDTVHTEGPERGESATETVPAEGDKGAAGRVLHTAGASENGPNRTDLADAAAAAAPGDNSFKCTCGKSFPALSRLRTHQRFSRNVRCAPEQPKAAPKKAFQCTECSKTFGGHIALVNHQRWHTNRSADAGQRFPCEECGKVFMTLTFYYKHQRLAHSQDTAAKSFLNQVCQLQKKAFECPDCGLKFSRASALQSHQLHHTDVFGGGEKEPPPPLPARAVAPEKPSQYHGREEMRRAFALADDTQATLHTVTKAAFHPVTQATLHTVTKAALHPVTQATLHTVTKAAFHPVTEANLHTVTKPALHPITTEEASGKVVDVEGDKEEEEDDSEEGYETADFHVEVISASESEEEEENVQDLNPDLELLCESDQENNAVSVSTLVSKPGGVDLKIVQIDFEAAGDGRAARPESEMTKVERKAAQHHQDRSAHQQDGPTHHQDRSAHQQDGPTHQQDRSTHHQDRFHCPECPRWFCSPSSLRVHRLWHGVLKNKLSRRGDTGKPKKVYTCDACGHETFNRVTHCNHILKHKYLKQAAGLRESDLRCDECGKKFSRVSTLISHQMQHAKRKPYSCPDCMTSYSSASGLFDHKKLCPGRNPADEDGPVAKKAFNPTKTLLGPKMYHCEQCGKGFWSLGAYSHHKQSPSQCTDLRPRNGRNNNPAAAVVANGHSRSSHGAGRKVACPVCGRKFRHQGIMKSHMRKHEDGNHACELCGRTFRLFSSLLRHGVVHRAHAAALPPPSKSFQHQVEQVQKNTYSCPDCGKLFSRAKALQFHMRSHGYESGYSPSSPPTRPSSSVAAGALEALQCPTCLAHFDRKSSLRAHRKLCIKRETDAPPADGATAVAGEIKTEPQISAAASGGKRIYRRGHNSKTKATLALSAGFHKSTHGVGDQTVGSFLCSECGRRFTTNSALGTHKRWHADKKFAISLVKGGDWKHDANSAASGVPYRCQNCGKGFFYLCVFRRHQIFCAPAAPGQADVAETWPEPDESAEGAELPCPECDKTFVRGPLLAAHYESEHCATLKSAHPPGEPSPLASADRAPSPEQPGATDATPAANPSDPGYAPVIVRGRVQCPLCRMTFAKLRGLRAHHWQAHAATHTKNHSKSPVATVDDLAASGHEAKLAQSITVVTTDGVAAVSKRKRRRKRIGVKTNPRGAFPCPRCGKKYSSPGALHNHKKTCLQLKQEPSPPQEVTPKRGSPQQQGPSPNHRLEPEKAVKREPLAVKQEPPPRLPETAAAEVVAAQRASPPTGRPSEHHGAAKYLFKCAKCGKAFQTEEQLAAHKAAGRSRPYCCALCCSGYWTEAQLQQHLVWHDEVRRRLPIELRYRLSAAVAPSRPPKVDGSPKPDPAAGPQTTTATTTSHKCQHCGRSFLSPTALAKHEAQHEAQRAPGVGDADTYTCPYCPRTFSDIRALIDHHQKCMGEFTGQPTTAAAVPPVGVVAAATTGHAGEDDDLSCLECGVSFSLETELHQHYMEHARGSC